MSRLTSEKLGTRLGGILVAAICWPWTDLAAAPEPSADTLPRPSAVDGLPVRSVLAPDTISAIDAPRIVAGREVDFLRPGELVLGVVVGDEARAYSLDQLNGHEIVNDRLGGRPIAATW